ncbi:MAG: class I SAM-dependent methyltransferase [PVC group bacterium]
MKSLDRLIDRILSNPWVYRLHSFFVNREKARAIRTIRADFAGAAVLSVGCGPGCDAPLFPGAHYTGVDISPRYIAVARKRYSNLRFLAGDAETVGLPDRFDVILINSLLHHIADGKAANVLRNLVEMLEPGGTVIVQEPLTPAPGEWYHRLMQRLDRGKFFRPVEDWRRLFLAAGLEEEKSARYELRILGKPGYHMISLVLAPLGQSSEVPKV